MFSEEFLDNLCRVTPKNQDNTRCDNCKYYISGALNNGELFCEKKNINDIPIDIRECLKKGGIDNE